MTLRNTDKYHQQLAEKWLTGKITPEEEKEFSEWYKQHQDRPLQIIMKTIFMKRIKMAVCLSVLIVSGSCSKKDPAPTTPDQGKTIPDSEVNYPGASTTKAFVAMEPYVLNYAGENTTVTLGGFSRTHDFSGYAPFVNPTTGSNDPYGFQAWYHVGATKYEGSVYTYNITNAGIPGSIEKQTLNGIPVTMVRYNSGDGITVGKCRSKLYSYVVPPRTHVKWDLEVQFGNADGVNDWELTKSGVSPVLFWALSGMPNAGEVGYQPNGPIALHVDTDDQDPTKLMFYLTLRGGTSTTNEGLTYEAYVHGISRNTMVPIVVEAFLDERAKSDGGKGILKLWVNNQLILEKVATTLNHGYYGKVPHNWSINTYVYNEALPYQHTRATFWKTARFFVFPSK
jgi:hypothetical protein